MITGNHARFSGTAKISRRSTVTFTVDVDDWQNCPDAFNIRVSNGYMASGIRLTAATSNFTDLELRSITVAGVVSKH